MKNIFLTVIAALFCVSALCDECLSEPFSFLSESDMEQAVTLKATDPIYYSGDLASGEPEYVSIKVQDVDNPVYEEVLMYLEAPFADGVFYWDYYAPEFINLPAGHTYLLTETIKTNEGTEEYSHTIKILPEPVAFLILGIAGFFFLRKRAKALAAFVIAAAVFATASARADGCVQSVAAGQFFPFDRMVIINYVLESEENDEFTVDFFCTTDEGATFYKLSEYGTLSGEGESGTVQGNGAHKIFWTPGENFDYIHSDSMRIKVTGEVVPPPPKTFMTIDLTDGSVSYSPEEPTGGWTEEYKTTKLALKRIEAGTFKMGSPSDFGMRGDTDLYQRDVTLTKPYYIGVFEVTQKQYKLITGQDPSKFKGDTRPVECVNFNTVTGEGGFFALLNQMTGLTFGLPTEAQWENACRAGTETSLNNGTDLITNDWDPNLSQLGRYNGDWEDNKINTSYNRETVPVGSYLPNNWGLYDMHGNVAEWCLDWIETSHLKETDPVTDLVGSLTASYTTVRGGYYKAIGKACSSAARTFPNKNIAPSNSQAPQYGIRVFMQIEE